MLKYEIRRLPIVKRDKLVGMLTIGVWQWEINDLKSQKEFVFAFCIVIFVYSIY